MSLAWVRPRRLFSARGFVVAVLLGALVFGIATVRLFVRPSAVAIDELASADAVVMFAGGTGERLDAVLEAMDRGVAPALVIPNGNIARWVRGNQLCSGEADVPYEVICPDPDPDDTRGEARAIAEIAAERGWTSLISVTSSYHVVRADLRLTRCFDGDVQRVAAGPNRSRRAMASLVAHEWLGLAQAQVLQRSC